MKIYVDGCSFVAATGLPNKYKLAMLIGADMDMSLEGKSNPQIVHDLHNNIENYDIFVLSFTFSVRTVIFLQGKYQLNILPGIPNDWYGDKDDFERYKAFHAYYYANMNVNYIDTLSDFYVDGAISLLKQFNKRYIIYSTELRNSKFLKEINQLEFVPEHLNYDKHFNEAGMLFWAEDVKKKLNE